MKTKHTNKEITLEFDADSEGDDNRGWQVGKITAFIEGNEVGYLKLAYIPKRRFAEHYPTIFNWMDQMQGKCILPRPKVVGDDFTAFRDAAKRHYKTFTCAELRKFLNSTNLSLRGGDISRDLLGLNQEQLLEMVREMEVKAHDRLGREFKKFKTYYVDKPIDDFIRVEPEFQRQGIAEHLYKVGVKWLESQNLPFYLSTCRQNAAELLAGKLRDAGHLRKLSNKRERFKPETIDL